MKSISGIISASAAADLPAAGRQDRAEAAQDPSALAAADPRVSAEDAERGASGQDGLADRASYHRGSVAVTSSVALSRFDSGVWASCPSSSVTT